MSYNLSYTNKFYCNYQQNQNGFFQNTQTKTNFQQTQQNFTGFSYQSNQKISTNFTEFFKKPSDFNKKTSQLDKNQKLLERIKQKKPIFAINRNQIRKKKWSIFVYMLSFMNVCVRLFGVLYIYIYTWIFTFSESFSQFMKINLESWFKTLYF